MDGLNIPASIRESYQTSEQEQGEAAGEQTQEEQSEESGQPPETVEAEEQGQQEESQESSPEATAEEDDEHEEDDQDSEQDQHHKIKQRLYKTRKQRNEARERAQNAEARIAELEGKLETAQPYVVQPTQADPLAHVTSEQELQSEKFKFRTLRDLCRQ